MNNAPVKKTSFFQMFLWWKIDEEAIEKQLSGYESLSIWETSRKLSSMLLLLSMTFTAAFIAADVLQSEAMLDVLIMGTLAVFVFMGHKWALIIAMAFWTYEKGYAVVMKPSSVIVQVIWWAFYMRHFYTALLVERRRNPERTTKVEHSQTGQIVPSKQHQQEPLSLSSTIAIDQTSETLRQLKKLKEDGVITEQDFELKKIELMKKIV